MKNKHWLLVGFAVFAVSVVGLVVGGQFFGLKTPDAGWTTYCPLYEETSKGTILDSRYLTYFYTGDGPNDENRHCDEPEQVHLLPSEMPWKVYAEKELEDDVAYAAREWNDRVSCDLFMRADDRALANITVTRATSAGGDTGGETQHIREHKDHAAEIVIYNLVLTAERQRGIMHELGHAMGLAHDVFKDSLMYRGTSGTSHLTDGDTERIEALYCP